MIWLIHELLSNEGPDSEKKGTASNVLPSTDSSAQFTFFTLTLISPQVINEIYLARIGGREKKN